MPILINKFQTIAEDKRDLPNGSFHYLENVDAGDYNSVKQVPNVYTKTNDQCILRTLKYQNIIYGIGYDNSTTKAVTLYQWVDATKSYIPLVNGTIAGSTLALYQPFFIIMTGVIYFDGGNGYIANYTIASNTMAATPTGFSLTGGLSGGTLWQGNIYGFSNYDHHIYYIDGSSFAALVQKVPISTNQDVVELVADGNYLDIVCTASQTSDDGVSRMMQWDGQNLSVTPFAEILDIGYGIVTGADLLDGLVYALIGFPNKKGWRLKAYSGGLFRTVYTYFGKKNEVSDWLYSQPASLVKAYTGYLYFIIVGARPGSSFAGVYEAVLFRYGKTNEGQANKLSAYKSLDVLPTNGNNLGISGNDFMLSDDQYDLTINDNTVYATIYESSYKTRQVYTNPDTYAAQPGVAETAYYTGGDGHIKKPLKGVSIMSEPIPAGGSITLKYKVDSDTSWSTLMTLDTEGELSLETDNDANGDPLPIFKKIAWRSECLGGAELTGLLFTFEGETNIV